MALQIRSMVPSDAAARLFVLFSDCFGDLDELATSLRVVRARGHDVIVMHVLAPEEIHFDFRHWSTFQSLESANTRLSLDPAAIREGYLRRMRDFLNRLQEIVDRPGR